MPGTHLVETRKMARSYRLLLVPGVYILADNLFLVVISLTDLQLSFFSRQTTQIFNDCYVRFFLYSLVCAKCKIIYPGNTRNPTADLHEFHCAWYIIIIIILMFLTGGVKGAKLLEFVSRSIVFRHSVYISSS